MQRVKELYEELGAPGQAKLWQEIRKRKIQVTRTQVNDFVARQAERQVHVQPLPQAAGQTASEGPDARYQLDVVNLESLIVVFLVQVFSRKTWARRIFDKSAESVLKGGKQLIENLKRPPSVLSTDDGGEYADLAGWLEEQGIAHKVHVADREVNSLAVLDRSVQDVKARYKRLMARSGKGDEQLKLKHALEAHNSSIHGTVHGTPNEAASERKHPEIAFLNLVDNAQKFEHNTKILEGRTAKLQAKGAFRKPLPGVTKNPFRRGFDAKYGPVERVAAVRGSTVVGVDGTRVDIKLVQAVPADSGEAYDVAHEAARTETKREKLFELMETLAEWLGAREASLRSASTHLARSSWKLGDQNVTYQALLKSQGFRVDKSGGGLADAMRLFPQMFKLVRGGLYFKRS